MPAYTAKGTFFKMKKVQIEIYKYLLWKGLRNLFSGFLEGPKCQVLFFRYQNIVDTPK